MKEGKKIPPQYYLVTFFYFASAGIISTFYYMFLQQKVGLDLETIGKVTSFGAAFSLVFQPMLGCWFSGTEKKKRFIQVFFLGLMLVLVGMIVVTADKIFLLAVLYGCLAIPMIGTYEIYIEAVCRSEGMEYSRIRKWGSIGMGTITLMGGYIITDFSFQVFHVLGIVFLIICFITVGKKFAVIGGKEKQKKLNFKSLVSGKYIKPLYLVCFLGMGCYVGSDFAYSTYLTQICSTTEMANKLFSFSTGSKIFLEFVFFIFIGKAADKFCKKYLFLFVFVVSFLRFACIATGILPIVIVGDLLHCVVFPVFLTVIFQYLELLIEEKQISGCYSVISMLMFGLSNLVFPPILSEIAGKMGFQIMYLTDCVLTISALIIGGICLPNVVKKVDAESSDL